MVKSASFSIRAATNKAIAPVIMPCTLVDTPSRATLEAHSFPNQFKELSPLKNIDPRASRETATTPHPTVSAGSRNANVSAIATQVRRRGMRSLQHLDAV